MRLFFSVLISAVFFACADNPLAERVDELEQRLDEVEAAQEEDRLSLLARLDALTVTADHLSVKLRIGVGWLALWSGRYML